MAILERLFGPALVVIHDDGRVEPVRAHYLLDEQQPDSLIKDSVKRVKEQLAQIPEGKTTVFVLAADWKLGVIPMGARIGYATRVGKGWEIHGEAFLSKADKGASIRAVWTK